MLFKWIRCLYLEALKPSSTLDSQVPIGAGRKEAPHGAVAPMAATASVTHILAEEAAIEAAAVAAKQAQAAQVKAQHNHWIAFTRVLKV